MTHLFQRQKNSRQRGFTLVEIAIVLVIIGLILAGILNAQSVLRNARTKDVIKAINDIANASQQFKDRYGAWPGVFTNAATAIPNMAASGCVGNTTGKIASAAESACASEELIRSTMLRGTAGSPITVTGGASGIVTISVTGAAVALSGVAALPASWNNVVRVQTIDCDIAMQIDRLVDDGNTATGNFRTGTSCGVPPAQTETITVANAVLRLN